MKRTWIMLLAVAMALVIALPAAGKGKPDKPDPKPEGGYTCADYMLLNPDSDWVTFEAEQTQAFTLGIVNRQTACVDVIAPAGDWEVTVDEAIGVRRVTIRVQDSVAGGDVCGIHEDPEANMILGALVASEKPTLLEGIQDAHVNACGTDWAEWVGTDLVVAETEETHPLAFLVFGGRGEFTITVTPPALP